MDVVKVDYYISRVGLKEKFVKQRTLTLYKSKMKLRVPVCWVVIVLAFVVGSQPLEE